MNRLTQLTESEVDKTKQIKNSNINRCVEISDRKHEAAKSLSVFFKFVTIIVGMIVVIALKYHSSTTINKSTEHAFVFVESNGYRIGNLMYHKHTNDLDNDWTKLGIENETNKSSKRISKCFAVTYTVHCMKRL